jgi:hypothetical protein
MLFSKTRTEIAMTIFEIGRGGKATQFFILYSAFFQKASETTIHITGSHATEEQGSLAR